MNSERVHGLAVRGRILPGDVSEEWWIDNGAFTRRPNPNARVVVDGGWILAGLVDAHVHLGMREPGTPLILRNLLDDGEQQLRAGVTAVRDAGALGGQWPESARRAPFMPRIISSGRLLAPSGLFFAGWGRDVSTRELAAAALDEARRSGGWCKVYGDWIVDDRTLRKPQVIDRHLLAQVTRQVHDAGYRIAVHAMHEETCAAAVAAGVDSIEHGMHLDFALLPIMADRGIALVPTFSVWASQVTAEQAEPSGTVRSWFLAGYERLGPLVVAAHRAGVLILAGTDGLPPGQVANEIRLIHATGIPAAAALAAGSWDARNFFGLSGIEEGAPADLVTYASDPRQDLATLDHPQRIIRAGLIIR